MQRLTEEINASKEWRVRELENLKRVGRITLQGQKEAVINQYYRMCVPYIYAHWEGFVVESFKMLITYLNGLNRPRRDFCLEIQTFALKDVFRSLSGKQKFEALKNFNDRFNHSFFDTLHIEYQLFTTKSNLNYNQLLEIIEWFHIENQFAGYKNIINRLVWQRNAIAHGENGISVTYENIDEYISALIELFDFLVMIFDAYIAEEKYLNP